MTFINTETMNLYKKNRDKSLGEWLKLNKIFKNNCKQGIVGIVDAQDEDSNFSCIFKISQYINYLINHESRIMEGLNEISEFCPNFCKFIGKMSCLLNPNFRKEGVNPLDISNIKYPIQNDMLLCEFISKSHKFTNFIRAVDKIEEKYLYSVIKLVLLALIIAQNNKKFTHYDLHSGNIMIKKCDRDLVFLYVLDEENQFIVPSGGYYPIIIDFGFSYIENLEDGPCWPSMGHTDAGFISDRFDWVADPKLFLVTVSNEINTKRKSKNSKKLRRIVRNIFKPLSIDWNTGWDTHGGKSAMDYVSNILSEYSKKSKLFREYDHYCLDLIQSLIVLPLEKQDVDYLNISYNTFLVEWIKIENQIGSSFYNLYILKCLINISRDVRADYMDPSTRFSALKTFSEELQKKIASVTNFCLIRNLNYEKILCSLYIFARNLEGVLFKQIQIKMNQKSQEYKKMFLKNTQQIYAAIECNLVDTYIYNQNTSVLIINNINRDSTIFKLQENEIPNINKLHPLVRGTYIWDLYKSHLV